MGQTPQGLPWPNDSDPVMAGAQAIRALAESVDALTVEVSPLDVYAALADLAGGGLAFPGFPIAYTIAPDAANSDFAMPAADMRAGVFVVRQSRPTLGVGFLLSAVAVGNLGNYTGATLFQYMPDQTWKFLANSGATKPAGFLTAGAGVGWKAMTWRDLADTADTPVALTAGVPYLAALTIGTYQTTQPRVAAFNSTGGAVLGVGAPGGWLRHGNTPQTGKRSADVLKTDQHAVNVQPLVVVY